MTRFSNLIGSVAVLLVLAGIRYWYVKIEDDFHDKAINANGLQRLWTYGDNLPLGTLVARNNQWSENAFVAERQRGDGGEKIAVLILDDHYRGDDMTYRSHSGVIGDEISLSLLCALPSKVGWKSLNVDLAVRQMINSRCANVR